MNSTPRGPRWRREGETPDYRFSMANERTFLAWIRTALAILAGAIAIDQLAPNIAPAPIRIGLCVSLAVIGAMLSLESYRRWALQERAMRRKEELPHTWLFLTMTTVVAAAALVLTVLILFNR